MRKRKKNTLSVNQLKWRLVKKKNRTKEERKNERNETLLNTSQLHNSNNNNKKQHMSEPHAMVGTLSVFLLFAAGTL